ncbi:MAG: hypothetical protein IT431_09855 [Phycisphaerales bacterium]|nr:hypothetical protein [Phycisphaerales bacterium]
MSRYRVCSVFVGACAAAAWGQCVPEWSEVFRPAFMSGGYEATATLYDDGTSVRLVVSDLERRGDPGAGLQVWDGVVWSTLSDAQFDLSEVQLIGADNEAPGGRLFAVVGDGSAIAEVAVLKDGAWSGTGFPVDSGLRVAGGIVPDPSTDEVYMFGLFRNQGDWTKVYKWDGAAWVALDKDTSGASVTSLAWFDDGTGQAMYAGVRTRIDGVPVQGMAKWDGQSWSEVPGCPAYWPTITVHDDGSGPAIWAMDSNWMQLAKWDGQTWTTYALESRPVAFSWRLQSVMLNGTRELVWLDRAGDGAEVWRWDGVDGERIGGFTAGWANDLIADDSGLLGGGLIAAGNFQRIEETPAACVAAFDGSEWTPLGTEDVGNGVDFASDMLALGDDAGALAGRVYVAADVAAGQETHGVVAWDGEQWHPIGPAEMSSTAVYALGFGDLGDGPRLFAAGTIVPQAGETRAIIAWDGQGWSVAGQGIEDGSVDVLAFGTIAGGEPTLYAAGWFTRVDGQDSYGVVGLTASGWAGLAGGLPDEFDHSEVKAIAVHDDGSGAALYADTPSRPANPDFTNCVVRWDGQSWTRVGDSLSNGSSNVRVYALLSADLGAGAVLYAAGDFDGPNNSLQNVAAWDGLVWQPLGAGLPAAVNALARLDTPDGPRLAAACTAPTGGDEPEMVWLWDGAAWTPFGAEASGSVGAITQASFDRDAVYLGGGFNEVAGVPSQGIARYGCPPCPADFNHDGTLDTRDFIAYLAAWAGGDGSADFNGDGAINTQDFIAYLNAWAAGC